MKAKKKTVKKKAAAKPRKPRAKKAAETKPEAPPTSPDTAMFLIALCTDELPFRERLKFAWRILRGKEPAKAEK